MFNQKVNGYWSENPDYVNHSLGAPSLRSIDIHNCGTNLLKYKKADSCASLPLQTWCSKGVAVESFAMRPIVNSKEYFEILQKFLASIIYTDSVKLKNSGMAGHQYTLLSDYGFEPQSSFLQAIKLEVTDTLMYLFGESTNQIQMFNEYNPICEGFVLSDIDIETYQCTSNPNHFFHKVLFSAFNTTRYNTVSFKADVYQDTTSMMNTWNARINEVENSKDVSKDTSGKSEVYVSNLGLLNNTQCVLGQENDCQYSGYNIGKGSFSQLLNDKLLAKSSSVDWLQPNSLANSQFTNQGNYDADGNIKMFDNGPSDLDDLINKFKLK